MVDADPRRGAAVGSQFGLWLTVATAAFAVIVTNVAVGAFLWVAIDARLANVEAEVRELRAATNGRFAGINVRLSELSARIARLEGKLSAPPPPPEGTER